MGDGFRFDLIPPGSGVLCALSGGADSMYLLCRLLEGRARYGWTRTLSGAGAKRGTCP